MKRNVLFVSNHALKRMIEREILCQNIKLNKKQVKRNTRKALRRMNKSIDNYFAFAYSYDHLYQYKYSDISKDGFCKKFVLDAKTKNIVTVINKVYFSNEIKKYNVMLNLKDDSVDHYFLTDYVYKKFNGYQFLFVIKKGNSIISSLFLTEGY